MKYFQYLLLLSLCLLVGCDEDNKLVEEKLSKIEATSSFTFDTINTVVKWDNLYIITPYESAKVAQVIPISETVRDLSMVDSKCVLVFVKNQEMVDYAAVSRSIVDFLGFDVLQKSDSVIAILPTDVFALTETKRAILQKKTYKQ